MYILTTSSSISVVNLAPSDGKMPVYAKELRFTTPISFPVHSIQINKSGDKLAIIGKTSIIVAEVGGISMDPLDPKVCRSTLVTSGLTFIKKAEIVKSIWHSLSGHHLVILSSDNTLRLLNVEDFENGAEQIYLLDNMLEEDIEGEEESVKLKFVNFCLGDVSCASWQAFTIYLLNEDSDIFALCPVVPYACRIASHYFSTLRKFVNVQMEEISEQLNAIQAKEARHHSNRRSPTSSEETRALVSHKMYLESQVRWIAAVCGIHYKSALDSSLEFYTHDPNLQSSYPASPHAKQTKSTPRKWFFDIALQGPLETALAPANTPQHAAISSPFVPAHDIFAISALPLVLGRSHASGHVELLVAFNHLISPGWAVPNAKFQPNMPSWLLWAGIDLSTQSGHPDNANEISEKADKIIPSLLPTPPTFLPGLNKGNIAVQYIYSSCGIVRIDIPWIHQLDAILSDRRSRDTPATTLQLLWNSVSIDQPLPIIAGVAPYVKPFAPSTQLSDAIFAVALYESGPTLNACFAPIVRPTSHSAPHKSGMGATDETSSSTFELATKGPMSSVQYETYLGQSLPAIKAPARLGPKTFRGNSSSEAIANSYNLQFYQHLSRQFDSCEDQLKSMEEVLKSQLEVLSRKVENDASSYDQSCKRLQQASKNELQLVALLQQRKAEHDSFEQRLSAVKKIIRLAVDRAIPIDSAWISELTSLHEHLESQKRSLSLLNTGIDGLAEELKNAQISEKSPLELEPSQIALYTSALNTQDNTIAGLVASLKKLQSQLSPH
jgi:WD40 repeat protein